MKKFPPGWDKTKIERAIDHYEAQSEDEAVSEDEAAFANEETLVQVPLALVADVRALIAKQKAKH